MARKPPPSTRSGGSLNRGRTAGWEIRKFTYENPWTRETIEQDRVFIPSKLQDNKFLGPEYVANLQMVGSDTLVRAWLEGDWTVVEGAYFNCFTPQITPVFPTGCRWVAGIICAPASSASTASP